MRYWGCKEIREVASIKEKVMKSLICPISSERVNENVVRINALFVVILLGIFLIVPNPVIPAVLAVDFFIRAFTKLNYSPLSWLATQLVSQAGIPFVALDKAPKIFAARVGFLFSIIILAFSIAGLAIPAIVTAGVLTLFATLECGFNFCAGCWVYTYVVIPVYKDRR